MHPLLAKLISPVLSYHAYIMGIARSIDEMHAEGDFSVRGSRFMIHMASMYWGIRGFMDQTAQQAMLPLLDEMGVHPAQGQSIISRSRLPWSMKSFFAITSDVFPVAHYKKVGYMLTATSLGTIALLLLGTLSFEALGGEYAGLAFMLLVAVNAMGATDDCLTQGKYTQVAKVKGSAIISFQYSAMNAAGIVVNLIIGYLNDAAGPQWAFLLCMPFAAQAIVVIIMNFMGDERLPACCQPDKTVAQDNWKIIVLGISMGFVALSLMVVPQLPWPKTVDGNDVNLIFGLLASCGLLRLAFWALPYEVANITVYLFLCRTMTLSSVYPLYQFYTAESSYCPSAPHFPNMIYQSVGGTMASIAVLGGTALFQTYVVHWNARRAFWVTTAFTCLGACFDIGLTTGFNRKVLGWTGLGSVTIGPMSSWTRAELAAEGARADPVRLDDLVSFVFGTSMLLPLAETLDGLPSTLLLSKLCPKNVESTVFAILAGFMNIGMSLSGLLGAEAIKASGFDISMKETPTGEKEYKCNLGGTGSFNGLAWCVFVGNIVLPALTIPLTFYFIPDIRLDEDFLGEEASAREIELTGDAVAASAVAGAAGDPGESPSARSELVAERGRSSLLGGDEGVPLHRGLTAGRPGCV